MKNYVIDYSSKEHSAMASRFMKIKKIMSKKVSEKKGIERKGGNNK